MAATWLNRFLTRLSETERFLLPRKKQRALEEMKYVLKQYQKEALRTKDLKRYDIVSPLLKLLENQEEGVSVDLGTLAECWLDLIRPTWYDHLLRRHCKYRPLLLKNIRHELMQQPIEIEKLREIFNADLLTRPLDTRIVATIVGVPPEEDVS